MSYLFHYITAATNDIAESFNLKEEWHKKRVIQELTTAGITKIGLLTLESHYLPKLIRWNEHIEAVVHGSRRASRTTIVATNQRVLFIEKRRLFIHSEELSYDSIKAIHCQHGILLTRLSLQTRMGAYRLRTYSVAHARNFRQHVQSRLPIII